MAINIVVAFTKEIPGLQQFISDTRGNVDELDALYVVLWKERLKLMQNGYLVHVPKIRFEESEG